MTFVETADAPPCPPWCTEQHDPIVGGWDADSVQAGVFYKRCRVWLPIADGLSVHQQVSVDRYASMSLEHDEDREIRDVQTASVYLCDNELSTDEAEALAGQLLEAVRLARL